MKTGKLVSRYAGFSLAEIIIAIGIATVLFGLGTVVLLRTQRAPAQFALVDTLVVDIKEQQTKAMAGDTEGTGASVNYGIFFAGNSYTLFRGLTYSSSDPANFVVPLENGQQFSSVTFPSNVLVFEMGSGQVVGFSAIGNSVTIQSTQNGDTKTISVNEFGSIDVN